MRAARKLKVSVTLSAEVVAIVDRSAEATDETRSGVIERWLRRAADADAGARLEQATAAYYLSLRDRERAEDEALSRGLSAASRRALAERPTKRQRR